MSHYKNTIKIIGFDLDQTLYPKSPSIDRAIQLHLYEKISEHRNCSFVEAGKLFRSLYQEGRGLSGTKTLEYLKIPNASETVQEAMEKGDIVSVIEPDEENLEVIRQLKKRYSTIDLITGSNMEQTLLKLKKLEIPTGIFNHILASDVSKSDGGAYNLWMSFYPDRASSEFLYIGDRASSDYFIPKEIGIQTILVNVKENDSSLECLQLESLKKLVDYLL